MSLETELAADVMSELRACQCFFRELRTIPKEFYECRIGERRMAGASVNSVTYL
jgi:hypothetical protein